LYIIFAFLLTSFAGCGKLKDSPVSGLNQTELFAPSEADDWFNVEASVFGAFAPKPKPKPDAGLINLVGHVTYAFLTAGAISYFLCYGCQD